MADIEQVIDVGFNDYAVADLVVRDQIDERVAGSVSIGGVRRIDDANEAREVNVARATHGQLLIEEAQCPCPAMCSGV